MFRWLFPKKTSVSPAAPEVEIQEEVVVYERGAQTLIDQGIPAWKVERAMKLVRRYVKEGALPTGTVEPEEK